jgi:DNA-binding MarR family transcriptional regulator
MLGLLLRVVSPAAGSAPADASSGAAAAGSGGAAGTAAAADAWESAARQVSAGVVGEDENAATAAGGDPALAAPVVSASEARALTELLAAKGIAQGQLAALLGLEKSTVSRLAAGLERKGWVRRGRDEENQRYVRLYLTPEGRALAGRVWRAWQSRQARILAGLSDSERAGLAAGMRGLIRGLAAEGLIGGPPAEDRPAG